jgi:hypothetical protein
MPPFESPMRAEVEEPGNRSIDIRMWSPRTFTRILAFEISLSPNLDFILESSSTSLVVGLLLKGMRSLRSARYQYYYQYYQSTEHPKSSSKITELRKAQRERPSSTFSRPVEPHLTLLTLHSV